MQAINQTTSKEPGEASISAQLIIPETFRRFNKLHIAEHLCVMSLFTLLVITGLPQRFNDIALSEWIVGLLGGIDMTRWIHRVTGLLFSLFACWHLGRIVLLLIRKKIEPVIVPTLRDFKDAIVTLRYYLGVSEEQARFGRYDFRQKFEYFGMLVGSLVMIGTGLLLMFPVFFTNFLPGVLIPVAKTMHGYESLLALLVIVIWHMYGAHFSPEVFPGDTAIFTGKISRERMERDHPLEYERILKSMKEQE
jgi:cytochrome b subunit of formate dehydrogenase